MIAFELGRFQIRRCNADILDVVFIRLVLLQPIGSYRHNLTEGQMP